MLLLAAFLRNFFFVATAVAVLATVAYATGLPWWISGAVYVAIVAGVITWFERSIPPDAGKRQAGARRTAAPKAPARPRRKTADAGRNGSNAGVTGPRAPTGQISAHPEPQVTPGS